MRIRHKKKIAVFTLTQLILFQTSDCYFLSVKMQNKNVKHQPSTKYLYFHKKKTWSCSFLEKNRKIKKFLLPTDQFFFQHVNWNTAFFFFFLRLRSNTIMFSQTSKASLKNIHNTFILRIQKDKYNFFFCIRCLFSEVLTSVTCIVVLAVFSRLFCNN